MDAINLAAKLAGFAEHYQPRTVAKFNGHDVMVVKVKGPFTWHKHDETDDFFLVLKRRITIQMREGNVSLGAGEMFVVPRGVEHCPVAGRSAHALDRAHRNTQHGRSRNCGAARCWVLPSDLRPAMTASILRIRSRTIFALDT